MDKRSASPAVIWSPLQGPHMLDQFYDRLALGRERQKDQERGHKRVILCTVKFNIILTTRT